MNTCKLTECLGKPICGKCLALRGENPLAIYSPAALNAPNVREILLQKLLNNPVTTPLFSLLDEAIKESKCTNAA